MRGAWGYTAMAIGVAATVAAAGILAAPATAELVLAAAAVACGVQLILVWALTNRIDPARRLSAYAAGALARFLAVGGAALLLAPRLGMAAAPPLLAMVAVFFLTTLIEPMVIGTVASSEAR